MLVLRQKLFDIYLLWGMYVLVKKSSLRIGHLTEFMKQPTIKGQLMPSSSLLFLHTVSGENDGLDQNWMVVVAGVKSMCNIIPPNRSRNARNLSYFFHICIINTKICLLFNRLIFGPKTCLCSRIAFWNKIARDRIKTKDSKMTISIKDYRFGHAWVGVSPLTWWGP